MSDSLSEMYETVAIKTPDQIHRTYGMNDQPASPYEILCSLCANKLAQACPRFHNSILGGIFHYEIEILALDALSHHKIAGASFWRLDPDEQAECIGGIEELLVEDLPDGIFEFYEKKLDKGPRFGYQ